MRLTMVPLLTFVEGCNTPSARFCGFLFLPPLRLRLRVRGWGLSEVD
jgi:hypothetical protein